MPQAKDLQPGQHFINSAGEVYEVLCQGNDYTFTRSLTDGEECLYSSPKAVSIASERQVQQESKISMIRLFVEESTTTREASEKILDYLQSERISSPSIIQEICDKYVKRCTASVQAQDDQLLDGINALAGAAMAIAGSDTPNYKVKAARCWPWDHPKHYNETQTEKFNRVFQRRPDGDPTTFRDRLVWAAVLIIAEIEKQDRKEAVKNVK